MIEIIPTAYGPIALFEDGSRAPLPPRYRQQQRRSFRAGPSYRRPFGYEILRQRWQHAAEAGRRARLAQSYLAKYPTAYLQINP